MANPTDEVQMQGVAVRAYPGRAGRAEAYSEPVGRAVKTPC